MKLAEALQERADLNRRIEQLRSRLENNAIVQEGEQTPENPESLKMELDGCIERLFFLISRINQTNCQVMVDDQTLTEMIARKDTLTLKLSVYRDLAQRASRTAERARNTEIKIKAAVSVPELQRQIDEIAKELRLLDNKLQENNWKTDLM
ncbi:MAG: DIP1984 family protein [Lachnospiraceae bacterium]|nr:DIP1984 family protein [Lachnospiraceae bacterium]